VEANPGPFTMPPNLFTHLTLDWLSQHAAGVLTLAGFKPDLQAEFVSVLKGGKSVLLCLGSFGVDDVPGCTATRELLHMLQS
jgi:hypothetical protein